MPTRGFLVQTFTQVSLRVQPDNDGDSEENAFYITLVKDASHESVRAGDSCNESCSLSDLEGKHLHMCPLPSSDLKKDLLRWFSLDASESCPHTSSMGGVMRVKDCSGKTYRLVITLSDQAAADLILREEDKLTPDEKKPNERNTVWKSSHQQQAGIVAFYYELGSKDCKESKERYYFTYSKENGGKVTLEKAPAGEEPKYEKWRLLTSA